MRFSIKFPPIALIILAAAVFLAACQNTPAAPEAEPIDLDAIPAVDKSLHTVPLEEVYFDTFRSTNRILPLHIADEETIRSLLDAIPPIYNPAFESAATAASWLEETDLVVGYAEGEAIFAYPIKILNWHEMVSHEANGRPILATY